MVVEDDVGDRCLYRRALEGTERPYVVSEYAYGEQALAAIDQVQPECILLDYTLPDQNGMQFLQQLQAQHAEQLSDYPSVVMITGADERGLGVQALRAGASDFLSKADLCATSLEVAVHRAIKEYASRKLQARVRRVEQMAAIGQMVASVAHELNDPTTFVLTNLELMQQALAPPQRGSGVQLDATTAQDVKDMLTDCLVGIKHIACVVSELRSQTRPQLETITTASLNEIAEAAYRAIEPQEQPFAEVRFELAASTPIHVDRPKIVQAASSLILNALQAAGPSGRVLIRTFERDRALYLTVADSGPGVPKQHRRRVFEPFYSTGHHKLGMGLALCADFVERHGGAVRVGQSVLGGASFELRLPVDNDLVSPQWHDNQGLSGNPARADACRVLVVDDEDTVLRAYERILGAEFALSTCRGFVEAVKLLKARHFDVVLCDAMMTQMDGIALFDEARDALVGALPRFVVCTPNPVDAEFRERLRERRITVLPRPLTPARLRWVLGRVGQWNATSS